MKYAIYTLFDDNYFDYGYTFLYSFFINNKWFDGDFIIINDNKYLTLTDEHKQKCKQLYHKLKILNVDSSEYDGLLSKYFNVCEQKKHALCFYKLEILRGNYDKILWLDSDIIVNGSLESLIFNNAYDGKFCACLDCVRTDISYVKKSDKDYFNGGVYLIDREIQKKYTFDSMYNSFLNATNHELKDSGKSKFNGFAVDQDLFNYFLNNDDVCILPSSIYNANHSFFSDDMVDVKIFHYYGPYNKPNGLMDKQNNKSNFFKPWHMYNKMSNCKTLVCCIAKLENLYLREWVEWYKKFGFTNICLYDNNDPDGEHFEDVIGDYIDSGYVIVRDVRGKEKMQLPCYQACYDEFGGKYDWIGFFDADEYFETDCSSVSEFLSNEKFANAGAVRLCWKNYDDSGLLRVENGDYSMNRFTTLVSPEDICNRTSKVIVRGGQSGLKIYQKPGGAHGQYLNTPTVDAHGNPHNNASFVLAERIWDGAWIRHYRFKTMEEYLYLKLDRLYPDVDKNTAKEWLSIDSFFEYNKRTPEKEQMYKEYLSRKTIGCFIFNYKEDDKARDWYKKMKDYYPTYILDTYHHDNGTHFEKKADENVIEYNNIFCGGLYKKAYELTKEKGYDWAIIIDSDVTCESQIFDKLISCISDVSTRNDIGVWDPSANNGSMCNGSTQILFTNIHQYYHGTGKMRDVITGEGFFEMVNTKVLDMVMPYTNYEDNKYGWGLNDAFNRAARKLGLRVVIDDRAYVHHPAGTGYNSQEAAKEYAKFKERFEELGLAEPEPKSAEEIKTFICCIGKNENRYVREYVEWYKHLGVTHIRIYDNNDPDGERFEEVIQDFVDEGYVDIVDVRGQKVVQLKCYTECYSELKNNYDWILFIDCGDEYLTFTRGDITIGQYLSFPQFRNYDLIHINLMTIGDNGLTDYDPRPLMERFPEPIPFDTKIAYNFPEDAHVSSIVRGGLEDIKWEGQGFTHTPSPNNLRCCNNVGFSVDGNSPFANVDFQLAAFRHYTTKTAREYCDKMRRGFPDQLWDGSRVKNLIETRFFRTNKVTKEKVQIFKDELGIDMSYLLPVEEAVVDKRDDVKIFSLCYEQKGFEFLNDAVITPLQVGAANGTDVCRTKDNTGDNISDKNYLFIENTGTYWIWKNIHGAKYKGQMQYRRPLSGVTEEMDFDKVFTDYDVITCEPFHHPDHKVPTPEEPMVISADTVEQGYAFSNCVDDLYVLELVIQLYHPDYYDDYVKYIKNGPDLYYSNGFIMKEADYDRYSEFLFDCLLRYLDLANIHSFQELVDHVRYNLEVGKYPRYGGNKNLPEKAIKWQCSILGFLSERVWTLWVQHNFPQDRILKLPYIKQEEGMYT